MYMRHIRTVLLISVVLLLSGLSSVSFAKDIDRNSARYGLPNFTTLVKEVRSSVVNISTTSKKQSKLHHGKDFKDLPEGMPFDDLLKKFFGDRGDDLNDDDIESDKQSLGSGFIISSDGFILTNYHVVKDADEIIVRLSDRSELIAKVIGSDKRSDIALLKVEATDLPTAKIGDSESLEVGEWVVAIGSPFGFEHSVTVGVVSAKGRSLPNENYVPFIQTDVAINPGNSGGPLFNLDGEVVGVNSQIFSRTGGYMGLSFAIPMDVAINVVEQLKAKGKVSRGWLGVYIQDVTRELAESFGMDTPKGALVTRVLPDSPAEEAKFEVGDVIVEYEGKDVYNSASLPPMVGKTRLGSRVKVKVIRSGKPVTLKVKIGDLPDEVSVAARGEQENDQFNNRLGIAVSVLPKKKREAMGLGEFGLYVEKVKKGAARDAGIQPKDIIMMVNGVYLKNLEQFDKLVKSLPAGKSVPVLVHRGSGPLFLPLKLPPQ